MPVAMRRFAEALLFALLLVAVQTAILTHDHDDSSGPAGAAVQSCEFCVGNHASAPAPEPADPVRPQALAQRFAGRLAGPTRPARISGAHRSRAPPAIRSV
jgi:hypothetical protein